MTLICPGRRLALAAMIALVAAPALALTPVIFVHGGWTRPTAAGMNAAGYLTIVNRGPFADRLTGASSPVARGISLHVSRQMGTVMTMRPVQAITVAAGSSVTLGPGGYHLMLEGLKRPLKPGMSVPLSLSFARVGTVRVALKVGAGPGGMAM